jgi:hypothetical protein
MSLYTQIYLDYEAYWAHAPLPFYVFLLVQSTLISLLAWVLRLQSQHQRFPQCLAITNTAVILLLITSTVKGVSWFRELEANEDHYTEDGHITARNGSHSILVTNDTMLEPFTLKLEYKVETYVLLGAPILVAMIISLFCLAVLGYVAHQYWYRPNHEAYEDIDEG